MTSVSASSHFIVRDNIRLHHLDWGGNGRHPVVLVHGVRLHAHVWNHFSRRFRDRFHIVALDQRGHGDSGWGAAAESYHIEDFYGDLRAVVEARGLSRFTLIGHSLGGVVSMLFAHRHHDQLERLVLVDVTAGRPVVPAGADLSRITETQPPREFDSLESATDYVRQTMALAPRHMVEESVRCGIRRSDDGRYTWKYDPVLFRRRRPPTAAMDFWQLVSSIPTPTLLQYGSHSRVVTPELAARMAQTMPNCTVERIEGAGHALFTDQPEAFAASVERFLVKMGSE
ncbi:MAG: alpha/beta hydrolase [Betaproteobacteria bacterium]|nr:alpha/beta hydrolase [Betaproteobacteria bacterium]